MKRLFSALTLIFALVCSSFAQTPTLVQNSTGGNTAASTVSAGGIFNVRLANTVGNNNLVTVCVQNQNGKTPSVTDDKGNTYTKLINNDDGNQNLQLWYSAGIPNNDPRIVTLTYATATSDVDATVQEWYNVKTTTPADGSGKGHGTGTALSLNDTSMTTTTNGDLIIACGIMDANRNRMTSWTKAAGYTFLNNDVESNQTSEFQVQSSFGSTTPTFTQSPSQAWNMVAGGFLSQSAGNVPPSTGLRVIDLHHQAVNTNGSGASETEGFPCHNSANTLVVGWIGVAADILTSITDTAGNTYTAAHANLVNGGSGNVRVFYASPQTGTVTCSDTNVATFNFGGSGATPGDTAWMYTLVNGASTNILDGACGTTTGTAVITTIVGATSVTLAGSGEFVISTLGITSNTVIAGSPGNFVSWTYTGEVSPARTDENNGQKFVMSPSTTAIADTWTSDIAASDYAGSICAFKAAAASSTVSPKGLLLGVGEWRFHKYRYWQN